MTIPVLLLPLVVTTANRRIRFKESTDAAVNVDIDEGTWFLRGDGAGDDLLAHISGKLGAAYAGGNTYALAIARSTDHESPHGQVSIPVTGSRDFSLLFGDAATTFDASWLGFPQSNTAHKATTKTSSLSPSSQWASTSPYSEWMPIDDAEGYVVRARSSVVRDGLVGGPHEVRRLGFSLIHGERWHREWIAADPDRAFVTFAWRWAAGRPAELHFAPATGSVIGALSSSTEKGSRWHLGGDVRDRIEAARRDKATSLWSFEFELMGRA